MTMLYPIVLETEESGAVSAYVPGLPVYAAAETPREGRARHSRGVDGVLGGAPGQSARRTGPRGTLLRQREADGRYRRRRGPGRRPSERHEGSRLTNKWPAWWSTSHRRPRRTTRQGVALTHL